MEISKNEAKLFLNLLNIVPTLPKDNSLVEQYFGNVKIGLFGTYLLKKKLEDFVKESVNANK